MAIDSVNVECKVVSGQTHTVRVVMVYPPAPPSSSYDYRYSFQNSGTGQISTFYYGLLNSLQTFPLQAGSYNLSRIRFRVFRTPRHTPVLWCIGTTSRCRQLFPPSAEAPAANLRVQPIGQTRSHLPSPRQISGFKPGLLDPKGHNGAAPFRCLKGRIEIAHSR